MIKHEPSVVKRDSFFYEDLEKDWQNRTHPVLMTRLARNAVPALCSTEWEIVKTEFGFAETILPLNQATTNQHGTHQAALIALSADYTGGMALTTLLTGIPVAGIHPGQHEKSASLWLAGLNMRFVKPSTGHLFGRCRVPTDVVDTIRSRYAEGKRCLVTLSIEFVSNGEHVASGEGKYFVQSTKSLEHQSTQDRLSTLTAQKLKASARMIAGIRASSLASEVSANPVDAKRDSSPSSIDRVSRFDNAHTSLDEIAAGPHGMLLAQKMSEKLPQLAHFVKARTHSIDQLITRNQDIDQLVLLGAGLDMRPFRMLDRISHAKVYELDLPEMLEERNRVLQLHGQHNPNRICIPANFLRDNLKEKLLCHGFLAEEKTVLLFEGCSMYFSEADNRRIFHLIRELLLHPESTLWCDFVDQGVVDGTSGNAQSKAFLGAMKDMGEQFVFGVTDPISGLSDLGFGSVEVETVLDYLETDGISLEDQELFGFYFLCSAKPKSV